VRIAVIWDVTPCVLVYTFRRFERNSLETAELTFHITLCRLQDDSKLQYLRKIAFSINTQVFQKFRNHLKISRRQDADMKQAPFLRTHKYQVPR